jgi:hypothetical protein
MKNRYGMDGMTYNALVDTNNGHIEISNDIMTEDLSPVQPTTVQGVDTHDRAILAKKFFELTQKK